MTELSATVFRVVRIGGKRYVLGLHPGVTEASVSIRELGRRVGYNVPVSRVRIEGALAFGRAEQTAKREARKSGTPWRIARKSFLATIIPPTIKARRKKGARHEETE